MSYNKRFDADVPKEDLFSKPYFKEREIPTERDVLFGRGASVFRWKGNVKFRQLVNEKKEAYVSTRCRASKQRIAREIIDEILTKWNGRFLIKASATGDESSIDGFQDQWVLADDSLVIDKVKQAIREKHYQSEADNEKKVKSAKKSAGSEEAHRGESRKQERSCAILDKVYESSEEVNRNGRINTVPTETRGKVGLRGNTAAAGTDAKSHPGRITKTEAQGVAERRTMVCDHSPVHQGNRNDKRRRHRKRQRIEDSGNAVYQIRPETPSDKPARQARAQDTVPGASQQVAERIARLEDLLREVQQPGERVTSSYLPFMNGSRTESLPRFDALSSSSQVRMHHDLNLPTSESLLLRLGRPELHLGNGLDRYPEYTLSSGLSEQLMRNSLRFGRQQEPYPLERGLSGFASPNPPRDALSRLSDVLQDSSRGYFASRVGSSLQEEIRNESSRWRDAQRQQLVPTSLQMPRSDEVTADSDTNALLADILLRQERLTGQLLALQHAQSDSARGGDDQGPGNQSFRRP